MVLAEPHRLNIFSDSDQLLAVFDNVPDSDRIDPQHKIIEAETNKTLGAEFNLITSISVISCDRESAFSTMEEAILQLLKSKEYVVISDWDSFGNLRVENKTFASIFKYPSLWQHITLHVAVDQSDLNERGFTMDYEIKSSPRRNDKSWTDASSAEEARSYIDKLRGELRNAIEQSLKANCSKAVLNEDFATDNDAIAAIAKKLKMTPLQVEAVRTALREHSD